MDAHSLNTASVYINNLLLARGLLRNGKPIDFAKPGCDRTSTEATMAQVINLVHDLVLRRDRETDQRENLASNVRALRNIETKQGLEIERLKTRNSELTRSLSLAEGQERSFKSTLRNAEASAKSLREQMLRMKSTLQQVRTQCANDIRKRDLQMQKLKHHLTGMQRGRRDGLGVSTITITPLPTSAAASRSMEGGEGLENPEYSLKQETTEFLTGLCQNLSDENDSLIGLIRSTTETLRSLQGLPMSPALNENHDKDPLGQVAGSVDSLEKDLGTPPLSSYESLATELDSVLDHLRTILTNPSFVPIEELEARDEEIVRLREGWLKMEGRWKEAAGMMDGWRRRMVDGGDSVNLDELKVGLGLGRSLAPGRHPHLEQDVLERSAGSGKDILDESDDGIQISSEDIWQDQEDQAQDYLLPAEQPQSILNQTNGNGRKEASPRKVSFHSSPEKRSNGGVNGTGKDEVASSEGLVSEKVKNLSSKGNSSRLPRQVSIEKPAPMSITQKLAAAEVEATVVRKQEGAGAQSKRVKLPRKVRGKRRSTLSPEELENLMGIHD